MIGIFPLSAAAVSAAFAIALTSQFLQWRKPQQAAWALAMAMFAVASTAVALGMIAGWNSKLFRAYYLFGAVLNVPVLAVGTLYLYLPRRAGHGVAAAVLIASVVAAVVVTGAPLQAPVDGLREMIPAGSELLPSSVRALSRYYSYGGFVVVLAGAVWSAMRLARRGEERFRRLAKGNALIALGTAVVAVGSAFARQGAGTVFAVGLALGVTVMFAGFLRTRMPARTSHDVMGELAQARLTEEGAR